MRILSSNLDNSTAGRGLYRVWEPICDGGRTRLVSRWIDPKAGVNNACKNDDENNCEEARELWLGMSLQFA